MVEWLNFHRYIGFDHAFIYCNDDDPAELYEVLIPFVDSGFIHFYHHPIQGQQGSMFTHFMRNHSRECEWFAFVDMDEFILLRHYDNIANFLDSFEIAPDAVHFNTLNAGHNGHVTRPRGSVIENYTMRSKTVEGFTKCIARRSAIDLSRLGDAFHSGWWHNIAAIMKNGSKIVNVIGDDMSNFYHLHSDNWRNMDMPDFHEKIIDRAALYHCGMKSEADMIRRYERGLAGVYAGQAVWKEIHDSGREAILAYLAPMNAVYEPRLIELRRKALSRAYQQQLAPPAPGPNLAVKGRAVQSSIAATSRFQDIMKDAAGVINGRPDGAHSHHTDSEFEPWWQVEFEAPIEVREVRILNRVDGSRDRFRNLTLMSTEDGEHWQVLADKRDDVPFGGVDGKMFIWRAEDSILARIIKIRGVGFCHLDFDQVEIY